MKVVVALAVLAGAVVAVGAQALPSGSQTGTDRAGALVETTGTTNARTTEDRKPNRRPKRERERHARGAEDVSGPCDEAEHANDPRCAGPQRVEDDNQPAARGRAAEPGEDVRGPCDEAEHANDPRCTGQAPVGDRDDRGEVKDDDHGRVDNSGPGSANSGPGSHHSGGDDDHSGRGHGGSDDD
jgi:hypothetical protein